MADRDAVLAQLDRILTSAAFRNSKRHSALLRHLVEQTLAGNAAALKERTLGVEVFGRPAEYDNYADPVVRVSAGEIRKRIAQYYHEPGRQNEIRIDLPSGSYVPEFVEPAEAPQKAAGWWARWLVVYLTLSGFLLAGFLFWRTWVDSRPFERFWKPFLASDAPVAVCLARAMLPAEIGGSGSDPGRPTFLAWPDAYTATKVAGLLAGEGREYHLHRVDDVTFEDMRRGPAVLIGAFNDVWTLRVTENLRFEFRSEGNLRYVFDRDNPGSRAWSTDAVVAPKRDYAVISRLLSSRIGKPVLIIAGLRAHGTEIAGESVTSRAFLESLAGRTPSGWQNLNLQVVIQTEIIDGHAGPARIEAVHAWR